MMKSVSIRLHGKPVGLLYFDMATSEMSFSYEDSYLNALQSGDSQNHQLSLSMPGDKKRYNNAEIAPFFSGILPDSQIVRKILAKYLHRDDSDDFGLLSELGNECPGAISVMDVNAPIVPEERVTPSYRIIEDSELAKHIEDLPSKPLFIDADGKLRLSLAGVHDKAAILLVDGKAAFPRHSTPTTHILKVDIQGLKDSIKVENYCLKLAREVGLDAVQSTIKEAKDIPYLLIPRYDRKISVIGSERRIIRLHQEDFCQALFYMPAQKYEKDGGPNWEKCFGLAKYMHQPNAFREKLVNRAIFQYLVGNPDAHAKNYSIVFDRNHIRLSPLYDLNNAAAFRHFYPGARKVPHPSHCIGWG